jgi:DNA-binding MurR/RpiR family transcriptional regulator
MSHDENRTIDFAREASLGMPGSIKQVADFLLSEGTGIAGMTMRQIAASAYTSKPTLVRFAKQAGYAGWKDYRHDFLVAAARLEEEQSQRADVDVNFPFQAGAPADEAFEGIARIHQLAIDEVRHSLDRDALSQAADAILGAHDVAFFGAMQNYHLGRVFASNLGIRGTLCRTPTGEEAAAVAGHLTQGDCLVVASYSGGLTGVSMALVPQAKRRGATVVAVTNSERSPLGDLADHTLSYAPLEHRHTKVGTFYSSTCTSLILDALYASCCAKRFETSVKSRSSIVNSLRDLRPNDFADTFADKTAWPQARRP